MTSTGIGVQIVSVAANVVPEVGSLALLLPALGLVAAGTAIKRRK